ncbi:hypothetical protein INT48_006647 [Thamnidium elegans]|uniref:Uncharacterized protein n=1 Tax=Thamnidium elegans TaxID=101142 RepID=A0A8H7SZE6_9FUNG|nr:hypothetical protein INT48_006647 [Thamnidium elegans]
MSDPFQVKPESKSWADMVEEEEEYERLHPEQDESSDISDSTPSLQPATDKSKEVIKELPIEQPNSKEVVIAAVEQESENDQGPEGTAPSGSFKEKLKKEELEEIKRKLQLELEEPKQEFEEPKQKIEEPKQELEESKQEIKEVLKEEPKEELEVKEEEPKDEESKVEEHKEKKPGEVVKEEEPEQVKETPKKEEIKLLSGSKASRWASAPSDPPKVSRWERPTASSYNEPQKLDFSAPSDPPKVSRWERPSTSSYDESQKLGSSASKWASAPASKYSTNRSKYDTNDRYDNSSNYQDRYSSKYDEPRGGKLKRSTFEDSGRLNKSVFEDSGRLNRSAFEGLGRLNRSTFEDSGRLNRSTFENNSYGSRNHYDKEFDHNDRNGGFDNKDNFRYNRKVEPVSEQEAEAIKQWNAYQPPADENDPVKPIEKPLPVIAEQKVSPVADQKSSHVVVEQDKELPVVQSPVKQEEKALPVVQEKSLPSVGSTPKTIPSILDFKPLPSSFSWADDIDNSDDDDEYDIILEKKEEEDTPVASGSDWSSFEEVEKEEEEEVSTLHQEPEVVDAKEEPSQSITNPQEPEIAAIEPVTQEEEKPTQPTFAWGSLKEEPNNDVVEVIEVTEEPKVIEEPVAKVEETPAPTYTWGSLEEPKFQVEQPQAAQAPSSPISKEDEEKALNYWNGFNKSEKPQETPAAKDMQLSDQVWEKYSPDTENQAVPQSTWNNNVFCNEEAAVPQEPTTPAWGALDNNSPAKVENSAIKDTWKSKLPAVVEDNASGWKSFAETVTAEPVIIQKKQVEPVVEQKKKVEVPVSNNWNTVQEPKKPQEINFSLEPTVASQQNVTPTISLVDSNTKAPKTISLSLADFVESSDKKAPKTISLNLADFNDPSDKKVPKNISLSLADFNEPSDKKAPKTITLNLQDFNEPSDKKKAPQNISFSFSDLNVDNGVERVAMKWGDMVEPSKEPKEISLKWSDIDHTRPREAPREVNLRWQDI